MVAVPRIRRIVHVETNQQPSLPFVLCPNATDRMGRQDILAGDDEEHAVLLHNFVLHLIMLKEGNSGANRRPPGRTGQRTEVTRTLRRLFHSGWAHLVTHTPHE